MLVLHRKKSPAPTISMAPSATVRDNGDKNGPTFSTEEQSQQTVGRSEDFAYCGKSHNLALFGGGQARGMGPSTNACQAIFRLFYFPQLSTA